MRITFSDHAEEKFEILRRYGFVVTKRVVRRTVAAPEKIEPGYGGRRVAQANLDKDHVLRVVFEEKVIELRIITFYPGRKARYAD